MKYNVLSGIEELEENPVDRYWRIHSLLNWSMESCIRYTKTKPPKPLKGTHNGSNTESSKSK